MKHLLLLTGLLSLMVSSASAQYPSEAQKRQAHLPFVRAATDCFAQAIAVNNGALDLVREGRWYDALSAVSKSCESPVSTMIVTHDRLYGPGTGTPFFQGPYVQDLPRAVGARLKDAIARRNDEVEQAGALRRQRVEEANRARDLLRDRMYGCTSAEVANLVTSSETAEVLATAAMTLCNRQVQAALDAAVEAIRAGGGDGTAMRASLHEVVRKNVVTGAVQARAAANRHAGGAQPKPVTPVASPANVGPASAMASPESCLKNASGLRQGKFVEQDKLISTMLDLCRPEIENRARSRYLNDPSQDLARVREKELETAVAHAKSLLGAQ